MSELPKVNVEIEEYWYRKCPSCHHIDDAPFTEASPMEPVEVRCSFCHRPYVLTYHRTAYDDLQREVERLRVQLAGCGVAALLNTHESRKDSAKPDDYGWSASYQDVLNAVGREIAYRDMCEKLAEVLGEISSSSCEGFEHKRIADSALADYDQFKKGVRGE